MPEEFIEDLYKDSLELLKKLIETKSLSKEEDKTADLIETFFRERNIPFSRLENNVWSRNQAFNKELPTVLLNSHHDTVKPNAGYTKDPFKAIVEGDKLFGLGSNDAGGPLVSLIAAFMYFYYRTDLKFNLILLASAEEEISGKNGVELALTKLPKIDLGIVGEPTLMNLAIAEKGLMVIDALATGKSGHAAREEGENAIYKAMKDINWLQDYKFEKVSDTLGPVKTSVTIINSGSQHNVVPDECTFTIDVRVPDTYTLEEVLEILTENMTSKLTPRSVRLQSSRINPSHNVIGIAKAMGKSTYGSPTMSDQALMPFETVKVGPGDSARSHSADEYIHLSEIKSGIYDYVTLLKKLIC